MSDQKLPLHVRILQQALDERKLKNSRYSMRALARDLDIDPASLSRILTGKQDISLDASRTVLAKLDLPTVRARLFIASVAEDKRNRSQIALTRALEMKYLVENEIDRDAEKILKTEDRRPIAMYDSIAIEKDCVFIMDLEGRFLFTNEAIARALKAIPCELVGEKWPLNFLDLGDPEVLDRQFRDALNSKKEMSFDYKAIGSGRYFRRLLSPVFGADGELTAVVSTIRDVTMDRFLIDASEKIHSFVEPLKVVSTAARTAVPILGDACIVRSAGVFDAFHVGDRENKFAQFIRGPIEKLSDSPCRIEDLPLNIGQELAFQNDIPTQALVCPLQHDDSLVFLAKHLSDTEVRLAQDFARLVSIALRNAKLFEMRG